MKKFFLNSWTILIGCLGLLLIISSFIPENKVAVPDASPLNGAWKLVKTNQSVTYPNSVIILADGYFTFADYDLSNKKFLGAGGGLYSNKDNQLTQTYEYYTRDSSRVHTTQQSQFKITGNTLELTYTQNNKSVKETWQRLDDNRTGMPGAWRIRERETEPGKMSVMQRGPRKTIKYLSGTRFQWAAINTETRQFFGTGGGTYTVKDGKYTEHIEFFSRDPQRVGMSLSFDHELKNGDWHHRGLSSTGNKIYEVWAKEK